MGLFEGSVMEQQRYRQRLFRAIFGRMPPQDQWLSAENELELIEALLTEKESQLEKPDETQENLPF
jgi:hypothetical protein